MQRFILKKDKLLKPRDPKVVKIEGQQYVSFRDIFVNLVINQINQTDYDIVKSRTKKVRDKLDSLSPKHRKRLAKQLRRQVGGSRVLQNH